MLWLIHEQLFKCLSISLVHLAEEETCYDYRYPNEMRLRIVPVYC